MVFLVDFFFLLNTLFHKSGKECSTRRWLGAAASAVTPQGVGREADGATSEQSWNTSIEEPSVTAAWTSPARFA